MQIPRQAAVVILLAVAASCASARSAAPDPQPVAPTGAISFAGGEARRAFEAYVQFLERDPEKFEGELATLRLVSGSQITYVVRIVDRFGGSAEGLLRADDERVFVNVSARGDEVASLNSRLAQELEHARQFECGE